MTHITIVFICFHGLNIHQQTSWPHIVPTKSFYIPAMFGHPKSFKSCPPPDPNCCCGSSFCHGSFMASTSGPGRKTSLIIPVLTCSFFLKLDQGEKTRVCGWSFFFHSFKQQKLAFNQLKYGNMSNQMGKIECGGYCRITTEHDDHHLPPNIGESWWVQSFGVSVQLDLGPS